MARLQSFKKLEDMMSVSLRGEVLLEVYMQRLQDVWYFQVCTLACRLDVDLFFGGGRHIERCTLRRPSIVKCLAVKRSAENALPGVLFLSRFSTSFLPEKRDGKLPFRKCFESVHAGLRDGVSS